MRMRCCRMLPLALAFLAVWISSAEYNAKMVQNVMSLIESGDEQSAWKIMDAHLERNPGDIRALFDYGEMRQHYGNPAAAVPLYQRALTFGIHPMMVTRLIKALSDANELAEARTTAVTLQTRARLARARHTANPPKKGDAPHFWNMTDDAVDELEQSYKAEVDATVALSRILVSLREEEAVKMTTYAKKLLPKEQEISLLHAVALDIKGQTNQSTAAYHEACSKFHVQASCEKIRASLRPFARRVANEGPPDMSGTSELPCNIERVDTQTLTKDEFMGQYVYEGRPVILTGMTSDWPAHVNWKIEALKKTHGSRFVNVVVRSGLATYHRIEGEPAEFMKRHYVSMTIKEFVESSMHDRRRNSTEMSADPPYFLMPAEEMGDISADYHSSHLFDPPEFMWPTANRTKKTLFSLGPPNAGAYFHAHSAAWNAVIHGSKRWFLFPPPASNYGPKHGSMVDWVQSVYPTLTQRPVECVQKAGEILFIPTGWFHGVLNLEDTVAVAVEIGAEVPLPSDVTPEPLHTELGALTPEMMEKMFGKDAPDPKDMTLDQLKSMGLPPEVEARALAKLKATQQGDVTQRNARVTGTRSRLDL